MLKKVVFRQLKGRKIYIKDRCFFVLSMHTNRELLKTLFGANSVLLIQRKYHGLAKYLGHPYDKFLLCLFKLKDFDKKLKSLLLNNNKILIYGIIIKNLYMNFWDYKGINIDNKLIINIFKSFYAGFFNMCLFLNQLVIMFFFLIDIILNLVNVFLAYKIKLN